MTEIASSPSEREGEEAARPSILKEAEAPDGIKG
jgi:hypothetical protein